MDADAYRTAILRLGFADAAIARDQGISAAARFFGVSPRTGRLWAETGPPPPVVACLRLMAAAGLTLAKAEALLDLAAAEPARRSKKRTNG